MEPKLIELGFSLLEDLLDSSVTDGRVREEESDPSVSVMLVINIGGSRL